MGKKQENGKRKETIKRKKERKKSKEEKMDGMGRKHEKASVRSTED